MIVVYTDGASYGNPGKSGAGVYIIASKEKYEYSFPLPVMSNHEAEFHSVIHALHICKQKFPNEIISLRTDSQIVVDTIENNYTKNKTFQTLLAKILEITKGFPYFFIKWISERKNIHADRLAKQAIQSS